jgi:type VI secretion system secreted protein VgrG
VPTTNFFVLEGAALPADAITVAYDAFEAISRPFEVTVEFYTIDDSFEIDACLREPFLLTVMGPDGQTRNLHGIADRAEFVRYYAKRFYFRLRLVPALSALAHREDCRIFQDLCVVDVVQQIFVEAGLGDSVTWQLSHTYPPREFIVQYRETGLNFVSRLLEDDGFFYYFTHSPSGHSMIVADTEQAFAPAADADPVAMSMAQGAGGDSLRVFSRTRSLRTTQVLLRDFDFEKPQVKPDSALPQDDAWALLHYEYPGGFTKSAEGKRRASARMRSLRADATVCHGESEAIGLRCGAPFNVAGAAEECFNGDFVTVELLSSGRNYVDGDERNTFACHNTFAAVPQGAPYAPPRVARRPRIRGIQTAIVTGPAAQHDQSIHVDKYGRVKVRFHWDRLGQQDDTSSCWLRVSQALLGGSMVLPRVGWEVSVAFLDGDPDRPFVLGRLYNAEKMPPYSLPGAKATGSIKSFSSPGGGGYNEVNTGDSGGKQGFSITAQKDLNLTTLHDKCEKIVVDEQHNVTVNMDTEIGANDSLKVGANQSLDVGANFSNKVNGNQTVTVAAADTTNVDSNYVEHIAGSRSYTVGAMALTIQNGIEHTVSGNISRNVGAAQITGSVESISDNILGNLSENVGALKVQLAKGSHGETVALMKSHLAAAADVHLIKGNYEVNCDSMMTRMVGGVHMSKVGGDILIKGQAVTMLGAVGDLKGGGSLLKLGGGPLLLKGSKIVVQAATIIKQGGTMKLGPG